MLQDADSRLAPPPVWLLAAVCIAVLVLQPAVGQENTLTNTDVLSLTGAGVPAEEIVVRIGSDNADFDTSFESLMALSRSGVSPAVIEAMSRAEASARPADVQEAGYEFREALGSGGAGPVMVVVPAGSFRMGCVSGECDASEKPVHGVRVPSPFAVGKYEVTFSDWDACVSAGGCGHRAGDQGWGRANRPVVDVSWEDTQEYVRWLSGETGAEYRLLSESEWEYAARAGSSTAYSWGNGIGSGQARYRHGDGWSMKTAPVGSAAPNALGLHDMHGNVGEWVDDCWNRNYDGAPVDGSAWLDGECTHRVYRGGSWISVAKRLRSAHRVGAAADGRGNDVGLRVARTLSP